MIRLVLAVLFGVLLLPLWSVAGEVTRNVASDTADSVQALISRNISLFYRAQHELGRFDAELEEMDALSEALGSGGVRLSDHESYPRLMAYENLAHESSREIAEVYQRALANPSSAEARAIVATVNATFKNATGADRLALNSLASEIEERVPNADVRRVLANAAFNEDNIGEFAARTDVKTELRSRADSEGAKQDETKSEVDQLALEKRQLLLEMEPATVNDTDTPRKIFPSSGKNGNVSGFEWPAGVWSLSFDDGPHPSYSAKIIANLKAHDLHAMFFEIAEVAVAHPAVSHMILSAGMPISNHSYTHPQLSKVSDEQLEHEVVGAQTTLTPILGYGPRYFRLPYGDGLHDARVRDLVAKTGLISVFWNVDSLDWQDKDPASIVARVRREMAQNKHGIILFHDIHPQTIAASNEIMTDLTTTPGIRQELISEVVDGLNQ